MINNVYIYIFCMAAITYLIRVLPLTLIRKPIKNKTVRSFLYYVPYVTLAVMTFPAILTATSSPIAAAAALVVAILMALWGKGLFPVAVSACVTVFIFELFLNPPEIILSFFAK